VWRHRMRFLLSSTKSANDIRYCSNGSNLFIFFPCSLLASDLRSIIVSVQCLSYLRIELNKTWTIVTLLVLVCDTKYIRVLQWGIWRNYIKHFIIGWYHINDLEVVNLKSRVEKVNIHTKYYWTGCSMNSKIILKSLRTDSNRYIKSSLCLY
jgi:hypothetical protein